MMSQVKLKARRTRSVPIKKKLQKRDMPSYQSRELSQPDIHHAANKSFFQKLAIAIGAPDFGSLHQGDVLARLSMDWIQ